MRYRTRIGRLALALALGITLAGWCGGAAGQVIQGVFNVTVTPTGTGTVDITYDLAYSTGIPVVISLWYSTDSGTTWQGPAKAVTGDTGLKFTGGGLVIHWDAKTDLHDASYTNTVKTKVVAWVIPLLNSLSPASSFIMGNSGVGDDLTYLVANEQPAHNVILSPFYIGKYEITNSEFLTVLKWALGKNYLKTSTGTTWGYQTGDPYGGTDPKNLQRLLKFSYDNFPRCEIDFVQGASGFGLDVVPHDVKSGPAFPMYCVTWYGAIAFCNWLSEMTGLDPCYDLSTWKLYRPLKKGFRLPTEAEWEYAAAWQQGTGHRIYGWSGNTYAFRTHISNFDLSTSTTANYDNPCSLTVMPYTSSVGYYNGVNKWQGSSLLTLDGPSPSGCYDMSGNLAEWVYDAFGNYTDRSQRDPIVEGSGAGANRVTRGGAWSSKLETQRTAARASMPPNPTTVLSALGFRVAVWR